MKKFFMLLIIVSFCISCSSNTFTIDESYSKDINSFNILLNQFSNNIENIWGINEILIPRSKYYINYTQSCKMRSHISFDFGIITFERIADEGSITQLRKLIISTLLILHKNINFKFFCSKIDQQYLKGEPILYRELLEDGKINRWKKRVVCFTDYLLKNHLQTRFSGQKMIQSIIIHVVSNHVDKRANKYLGIVKQASKRYGVDQSLILAIIQIESSFNPHAVSHADALGLMQIVQHSAGRDVFKMKGKWGQPSRKYLFNPANNIDIGTAYLSILQNHYLNGISNPISRSYAVITAYHSGVGSVLKVFSSNQSKAIKIINQMQPEEVYKILCTKHPSEESRRYLHKVNVLKKNYQIWQNFSLPFSFPYNNK
ncbi:membrane-bound lytic murein transglycosylase MltC [Candidatus Schneideria nysicola]|uniref:membrane-bound lytic murein transglycosylase MltC n=1 Tax=Candidatus Schneideria nysicola TaxID=1081631 RepID=UPI001CAA5938|nr:membrane-bound lytic murein transglycosylase MltC [Candidatus Schneideria nysicola]UAJ65055.1 membrane-bound lytic murein transglycosylase MltC [Candidatus Schneideria nysicola]